MTINIRTICPCCVLFLLFGGCDSGPDLPPMADVRGIVTLDGAPLPRGMLQFVPDRESGNIGPPAVGDIAEDGSFELKTAGRRGALIGKHRVRIVARNVLVDPLDPPPEALIPERYFDHTTSGVYVTVEPDRHNEINLELTTAPTEIELSN